MSYYYQDDATKQNYQYQNRNKLQSDETQQQMLTLPQFSNLQITTPEHQYPSDQLVQELDGKVCHLLEEAYETPSSFYMETKSSQSDMYHSLLSEIQEFPCFKMETLIVKTPLKNEIVQNIIERLLNGQQPNDQEIQQLDDIQLKIVELISEKKQLNRDNIKQTNKRTEEKQKFFFKKAFKYIEKQFVFSQIKYKNIKKNKKRSVNPLEFYSHYFQEVADQHKIKIDNFLHPEKLHQVDQKKKKSVAKLPNRGLKSMNQTYVGLILKSRKFLQEIKSYLANNFLDECTRDRRQKINIFLMKCTVVQNKAIQEISSLAVKQGQFQLIGQHVKRKLCSYILENPKCKIPWSQSDINEVVQYAQSLIQLNEN